MSKLSRRTLAGLAVLPWTGAAVAKPARADMPDDLRSAPSLTQLTMQPLLTKALYSEGFSSAFDARGACELNMARYTAIGFQRWGADWVTQGLAVSRSEWVERGWRQLDYGLSFQQPDGGFGGGEVFFSTGQFVEALARACTLDPGRGAARLQALHRAALWHMSPPAEAAGIPGIQPYTHRRYVFAAALGLTSKLTGDARLRRRAELWAWEGVRRQAADGTNPEAGGFDASYQMVSVQFGMRYLPACEDPELRAALRQMARRAVAKELTRMGPDGRIDEAGSTRVGKERLLNGRFKTVNYREMTQTLAYAALGVPDPSYLEAASLTASQIHSKR